MGNLRETEISIGQVSMGNLRETEISISILGNYGK